MIRINIFLSAYFRYRDFNHSMSNRSTDEGQQLIVKEEKELVDSFTNFDQLLMENPKQFSLMISALFIKCLRCLIKKSDNLDIDWLKAIMTKYSQ